MSRILIIDDDYHIGNYITKQLADSGFEVQLEPSGQNFVDKLETFKPAVAALDVMLPGISGFELCRMIRSHPKLYATSVLVLTAMGDAQERDHAIRQGADDFLAKPFKMFGLLEKLRVLVNLHEQSTACDGRTNLATPEAFKKIVAHNVACKNEVCLCCLEIAGLNEYRKKFGAKPYEGVILFTANLVEQFATEVGVAPTHVSHLGGGFFGLLVSPENVDPLCGKVASEFEAALGRFYTPEQLANQSITLDDPAKGSQVLPLMTTSTRVVSTGRHNCSSLVDIFSELDNLLRGVRLPASGGIFVDRRDSHLWSARPRSSSDSIGKG